MFEYRQLNIVGYLQWVWPLDIKSDENGHLCVLLITFGLTHFTES